MARKTTTSASERLPQGHPQRTTKQEKELAKHIVDRLTMVKPFHEMRVARYRDIDVEMSGQVKLSRDDKRRNEANKQGEAPKPIDHNLELTATQIDEAVTYCMEVFAPETGIFEAKATKDKMSAAQGIAAVQNRAARVAKYFLNMNNGFTDMYKYNFGGWVVEWEVQRGKKISDQAGQARLEDSVIWQGNTLCAVDPYNTLYDIAVHPSMVAEKGEFFSTVEIVRDFRLFKQEQDKEIVGAERVTKYEAPAEHRFYQAKPQLHKDTTVNAGVAEFSWDNWFGLPATSGSDASQRAYEIVTYYGWLNPKKFGLSNEDELQIWRVSLASGRYVLAAEHLTNAHGRLPCGFAVPKLPDMGMQAHSYAETLQGLNHYGSFLINADQKATRKKLHGITVYDSRVVDMSTVLDDEVAATIPAKQTNLEIDLRKAIAHFNEAPDTSDTMTKLAALLDLMQKILPTDQLRQVTDLERATEYQALAAVQGTHRRSRKQALLINDQAWLNIQFQMVFNILQFQERMDIIDDISGKEVSVDPAQLREQGFEYSLLGGVRGVDRLMMRSFLSTIMQAVLQSQQASEQIDIVLLLDFITSFNGIEADLSQFRRQQQPVAGTGATENVTTTIQ